MLYFANVSRRIYDESVSHLTEVYSQVNNQFKSFIDNNKRFLTDFATDIPQDDEEAKEFIAEKKANWKFSEFFFLSGDKAADIISPDNVQATFSMNNVKDDLFVNRKSVLFGGRVGGATATVFAVPLSSDTVRTFAGKQYTAIAVSYTNSDLTKRLSVNAFSQKSTSFVIDATGNVFLTSQEGDNVIGNYLAYLKYASDLDAETIDRLGADFASGKSDVFVCGMGKDKAKTYILYQSIDYQGLVLLGLVPVDVADASLADIQSETTDMFVKILLIAIALIVVAVVYILVQTMRKNKSELKYREMLFDTLNVRVNDIFLMLNAKTLRPDYLSPNVERLLGVPHKAAVDDIKLLVDTYENVDDAVLREDFDAIPVHGSKYYEHAHIHQSTGERRWFYESIYHELINGMEKYIVVLSDRTGDRILNERLEQALATAKSANEAKSHFLSNMSHDIRTPMNAIIGLSVLLQKDAENPDKVREYTRKISSSGQHLLSLINDVLDMSKIESGKTSLNISEFRLPDIMDGLYTVMSPQAKAKNQIFEMRAKGCPPDCLLGDKLHLNQILINILSNAIKYTDVGGKIDFTVQGLKRTSPQYATIRFIIEDSGFGMSKEFLKTIFDPFSREVNDKTRSVQGTGLGMAITKNLVDLMGGVIDIQSELGKGSTFTVDISFAVSTAADEEDFWKRHNIFNVLVADDDELICNEIKSTLGDIGLNVTCVSNGAEAVDAAVCAYNDKNKTKFDVILLDWKMPIMNGVDAARKIREKIKKDVPILVLSSYDWSDIEDEARAAGIDAFMTKPFFPSAFRYVVESIGQIAESGSEQSHSSIAGIRFLAAEDNEINADILSELLQSEGAYCDFAVNGKEAFEMFAASDSDKYDMILMDVQMPIMNGYESTKAIRECSHPRAKTIPIIAMTANAFAEDVKKALDSGMNAHLSKPIDMDAVRVVIGKYKNPNKEEEKDIS